jgi:anti-anti-sigma factor
MKPTIQNDHQQKTLHIVFHGDLVSTVVREFRADLQNALIVPPGTAPWQTITFDLKAAKMVDSMGLNLIVKFYKGAQQAGARMRLIYTDPDVHRTLIFTRMNQFIELVQG